MVLQIQNDVPHLALRKMISRIICALSLVGVNIAILTDKVFSLEPDYKENQALNSQSKFPML
jgi:hypothetical protein